MAGEIDKKRILLAGQTQNQDSNELTDDQLIKLSEALLRDLHNWNFSLPYRIAMLKEILVSAKSAAFSELENPLFQASLRAMAFLHPL